jgi:hypothetical protein
MDIEGLVEQLDHRTDSIISTFDSGFTTVLQKAQVRVALALRSQLDLDDDGDILTTVANLRVIKALPTMFRQALDKAGYDDLVVNFLASFDGGLPIMDDILAQITNDYAVKVVKFTPEETKYFTEMKTGLAIDLEAGINTVAVQARRATMSSLGGTAFEDLTTDLAERLSISYGQSSTIAATGISTFYRTIADRGYQHIEGSLAKTNKQLEYTYAGPQDKLTRPFCTHLMHQAAAGKTWTRAQIENMDNDQLPNVFQTCGGFNCRHQWIVALEH